MRKNGKIFYCQTCGVEFYRAEWQIKRNEQKFCSLECRRHTDAAKEKMKLIKLGAPSWNTGLTMYDDSRLIYNRPTLFKGSGKCNEYQIIRKSAKMRKWVLDVFKRDNYTCQHCGRIGGKLNAHHIKSFSQYPDLRFELNNGLTLCEPCHAQTDSFPKNARKMKRYATI